MIIRRIAKGMVVVACVAISLARACADDGAAMPARHLDPQRLEQVSAYFRHMVTDHKIAGATVLIQQHGRPVFAESFGVRDPADGAPMTADAIFRIYSMSKPITAVAAMMLVDDGKLKLDDPLAKYIPAFANVTVGARHRPLARPITIEDLLRHTSGITYGFYGETAVRKLYATSDLYDGEVTNAKFVDRLAKLPLQEQPGTLWDYGHSADVLGRVIEVISGQTLYQFEKERLLDPLGMHDTMFELADPAMQARVAEPLPADRFGEPIAGVGDRIPKNAWQAGGAGMVSTIHDYARLMQMLLNGGTLDGRRYLKTETVATMTTDHLGPGIARDDFYFPGPDSGFGLGFAVRTKAEPPLRTGEYRWDGVGGTCFFVDPEDDLFVIVMMRSPSQRNRVETDLRLIVYDALRP